MPDSALVQKAKRFLTGRAGSYKRLFDKDSGDAKAVLIDLARFCRANQSTFHPDPHVQAELEGRREVWLRIMQHTKMTNEELYDLYNGPKEDNHVSKTL